MNNYQKNRIFLSKNTKTKAITVEEIHNPTGLITTLGSRSLILSS